MGEGWGEGGTPARAPQRPPDRQPLRPPARPSPKGGQVYVVPPYAAHVRLDAFLTRVVGERSRAEWQRLIELEAVLLNERPAKASSRVSAGDRVRVLEVPAHLELEPEEHIPLDVVYEDEAIIVVNKPAGLVVHPAPGHERGTLVNALLARCPELRDPTGTLRPGIVHRLDKDTSGLMVVGKTTAAMANLQAQFKHHTAAKRYLLLVCGTLGEDRGIIDAPIARDLYHRQKMAVRADGRPAQTEFWVRERLDGYTLVEAQIHTGRTHQLRVHFAYIGHPVAGDAVYGRCRAPGLTRQFVHSCSLGLRSPLTSAWQEFAVALPEDLDRVLQSLRPGAPSPQSSPPAGA
ncbi:MAG: RluA family pseudouridine synthase [Chloroflexi bacterium]|nr:RluA family pseudouridine synthase [Chloroflexota bacterium]